MKMIIRTLCAAALVFGALSLTGCGDKKDGSDTNKTKSAATSNGTGGAAASNKTTQGNN